MGLLLLAAIGVGTWGVEALAEPFGGVEFPLGAKSFADRVVSASPGEGTEWSDATRALGPPDHTDDLRTSSMSLGNGGSVVLAFLDNYLVDRPGPDLYVFEVGKLVEPFYVAISEDGSRWLELGTVSGQPTSLDISGVAAPGQRFAYVRITDANTRGSASPYAGADVDAVGAIGAEERAGPPCDIRYMTLNPGTEMAGPLLTPGLYWVWTAPLDEWRDLGTWQKVGPYEFTAGHEYTVVMDNDTARFGEVTVYRADNGMANQASAHYVNDAFGTEMAVTVCPANTPPPPPPPAGPPCDIRYMTLNPGSELAGPIVSPGQYTVWTAVVIRSPTPPTQGLQWRSVGPVTFNANHRYFITLTDDTAGDGSVYLDKADSSNPSATVHYANDAFDTEYAVTVCPAGGGGGAVAAALDADNDGILDDTEISTAIQYWILGASVPGAGQTISDARILELIQLWILGAPVGANADGSVWRGVVEKLVLLS